LENYDNHVVASFVIKEGFPSSNFISSPEIRNAIQKYKSKHRTEGLNKQLDYISFEFIPYKTMMWGDYFPLSLDKKFFSGRGITSWLELMVVKDLKKKFPSLKDFIHLSSFVLISKTRKNQFKKRGIDPRRKYSYVSLLQFLRRQVMQNRSKARRKKVRKAKVIRFVRKVVKKTAQKN